MSDEHPFEQSPQNEPDEQEHSPEELSHVPRELHCSVEVLQFEGLAPH